MGSMVFPMKGNETTSVIFTPKDQKQKARIDFEGMRFVKEDNGLCVGTWAIATDAYNKNDAVKFPCVLEFRLDYNDVGDKVLGHFIEQLDPEKSYSGFVEIDSASKTASKVGKAITDGNNDLVELFKDNFIGVVESEMPEGLAAWKPSEKKQSGGYKSKSALEIAKERWVAIKFMSTDETMAKEVDEFLTATYGQEPTGESRLKFWLYLIS